MKIVLLVLGIIIGVLAAGIPRTLGIDVLKSLDAHPVAAPAPAAEPVEEKKDVPAADPGAHPKEMELRRMIADVSRQRAALDERERPLAMREAQIEEQRKALEVLKQSIDESVAGIKKQFVDIDATEIKNLKKVGKMWSQMEPADVVRVAATIDKDLAVKVMSTMTEKQSGAILGSMSATPEYSKLAGEIVTRLKQLKPPPAAASPNGEAQ
jgi:flagellar motility protein MotE (MotC chaperone)